MCICNRFRSSSGVGRCANMERWLNDDSTGNPRRQSCPSATLFSTYPTPTFSGIRCRKPANNNLNSGTACRANSFCLASLWNDRHCILNVFHTQSVGSDSPSLVLKWSCRNFWPLMKDVPQAKNAYCVVISVLVTFRQVHKMAEFPCRTRDG
jgi:hypothetical protein